MPRPRTEAAKRAFSYGGGGGGGAVMWNGLGNNETKLNYFKYALTVWNWGGLNELR